MKKVVLLIVLSAIFFQSCNSEGFDTLLGNDLDSPFLIISSPNQNEAGINVDNLNIAGEYGIFLPKTITLYYGTDSNPLDETSVVVTIDTSSETWNTTISALEAGKDYYFISIATDADGNSIESEVVSAKTKEPGIFISSPIDSSSIINSGSINVIGYWEYFTPSSIIVYYGTDSNPLDDASIAASTNASSKTFSASLAGLTNDTQYYIQAVMENASGEIHKSSIRSFNTVDPTNVQFTLANPKDGETFVSNSITFSGHVLSNNAGVNEVDQFELLIDGSPYLYVSGDLIIKQCSSADSGDADEYCDAYSATCVSTSDYTDTSLNCDCSGLGCDWFVDTSGLDWNQWLSIGGRFTDDLSNTYSSNTVQIIAEQKLSFGETIASLPADESFSSYVNYTDITDPVIIAAIKPSEDTDSYVDGTPASDEDTDSAFPIVNLDSANNRFRVRVVDSDDSDGGNRKVSEDVWYFMVEANTAANKHYVLSDGNELEACNVTLDKSNTYGTFQSVSFLQSFSAAPLVFTTQISDNNSKFLIQRIQNVTVNGFELAFQQDDGDPAPTSNETISYVAIDLSNSTTVSDHTYSYGIFNGKRFQIGRKGGINEWNGGTENDEFMLSHLYTNPLVFIGLNTSSGGEPAYGRVYKITDDGSNTWLHSYVEDVQVAAHVDETIVYFTVESN